MKNVLLFLLAMTVVVAGYAQNKPVFRSDVPIALPKGNAKIGWEPVKAKPVTASDYATPVNYKNSEGVDFVTVIPIGTSANAYSYGYAGGQKQIVWADEDLNIVTNFHRMGGELDPGGYSGDYGYDISTDGGMTWTNMVECYISTISGGQYNIDAARYPNHGVYNPEGNTDPGNAYVTFFGPTLDATNGSSWGGWAYGRQKIGDLTDTTKNLEHSTPPDYYLYIPDAFDVAQSGAVTLSADIHVDWTSGSGVWLNQLLLARGVWDEGEDDFVYEKYLMDFPTYNSGFPAHVKVAFSPDGQTCWMAVICDDGQVTPLSDLHYYYPVFFKSTDAGESWSDPIAVRLDGPDGIPSVLNYLTDEMIAQIFLPPLPARDEIQYTTAFDCDLAVDAWGNPHLAVVIGVGGSTEYSIVDLADSRAAWDVFSTDGGTTWDAYNCGLIKQFRGNFPDDTYTEDNRIQIASTMDGDKMVITWLDTWLDGAEENNAPDVFARGIDVNMPPTPWYYTLYNGEDAATYVTEFSEAMWQCYFAATSKYILEDDGSFTIPIVYQQMTAPFDPALPVQYKYIQDFIYTEADFALVGIKDNEVKNITSVSQNYPNPFSQTSTIDVNLVSKSTLSLVVTNIIGQQVMKVDRGTVPAGTHQFVIDGSKLESGIYFYTVYSGEESVTKKMMIE
jgi:hypothetical protein